MVASANESVNRSEGANRLSSMPAVLPLRFVAYDDLGDVANVVVDGAAAPSTRLTLSHWPGSPTPPELCADLSAQIAFRALERPRWFDAIDVVSNNHFDQDGLASVYALVDPDAALARRELVIDVARAGDFGTFTNRDAARIAIATRRLRGPADVAPRSRGARRPVSRRPPRCCTASCCPASPTCSTIPIATARSGNAKTPTSG